MSSLWKLILKESNDLLLAFAMIGILLVLITPIHWMMLDFLILTNFSIALLILLVTFYIDKPLSFSTFPSLLLMTTLFRLALNISATRLILEDGDAGKVINAIGSYVVGGNYIIGFIIFLILIIVQYVVVTNGAQRVAEVAARFTLDSLPGKQMSIDADLNMGIIDQEEAKNRRAQLERESNFYGAMDGASKFVKGDAIAGILIIIINIIGGLSVGVLQKDMSWADALHRYTLLTVGDGIVTQIPSLIIAISAGIIITRAATDAKLGQEVAKQLSIHPKALVIIAFVMLILMVLPGLPILPLMILFSVFMGLSIFIYKYKKKSPDQALDDSKIDELDNKTDDLYSSLKVEPFELNLGTNLAGQLLSSVSMLETRIEKIRKQFTQDFGFPLPKIHVRLDKKLPANHYNVLINGAIVANAQLEMDSLLAINSGNVTTEIIGIETREPTYGLQAKWIQLEQKNQARTLGYTLIEPETVLVTHLSELSKRYAADFLSRLEVEVLIEKKKNELGSLVDELIPQVLSYSDIQRVLQLLLREQVSIRNLRTILEVLVDVGRTQKIPEELAEKVRERLGSGLYEKLIDKNGELHVVTLAPKLESTMLTMLRQSENTSLLPITDMENFIINLVKKAEQELSSNRHPILLCATQLRRSLRAITLRTIPHLTILSVNEVNTYARIVSSGIVEIPFSNHEAI